MGRTGNGATEPRDSTRGEAAILEFSDSDLSSERLRQRAPLLLNDKGLLRNVRGLTPGDQARFVDKVDQVCDG